MLDKEKRDVLTELSAIRAEKDAFEVQLNNYKNTFAKSLINDNVGKEMMESVKLNQEPVKMKKPLKMRLSERMNRFKNKMKVVLGFE